MARRRSAAHAGPLRRAGHRREHRYSFSIRRGRLSGQNSASPCPGHCRLGRDARRRGAVWPGRTSRGERGTGVRGPAHRGRGLASRSLRLMTSFCHDELGLTRLRLSIVQGNVPSQRVAESAGYVRSDGDATGRTNRLGQPKLLESWHWIAPATSG
ncbi:GNAT family N-acetyltransferase [Micromonospora hortensis]|uniref:GNAT family N-acetyltransferase n=1 Tax=Micromonospora hortensis TaxID=2911209 RepID=UPI003555DB54